MDQQLLNQVTQQLKVASNASQTPAGQSDEVVYTDDQLNAINQVFELFRFNYHNQFLKAFPDLDSLNMAKRLWLNLLSEFDGEVIMQAAKRIARESGWLPSVHDFIRRCDPTESLGLPSVYAAYVEACRAPSPKKDFNWSHPAVYYAGRASDWHFLANNIEDKAFPVFERNYLLLINRIQAGEDIELELPKALPKEVEIAATKEEADEYLNELTELFKDV